MTLEQLKVYLNKVVKTNPEAKVSYKVSEFKDEYNITDIFSYHDEGYIELFSDVGFSDEEVKPTENRPAITVSKLLQDIEQMEADIAIPLDTRLDLIVGNEDMNYASEIMENYRLVIRDEEGKYIPHKKDTLKTGFEEFREIEKITKEENTNFTLQDMIEETVRTMKNDFPENSGEDLTIEEQELSEMYEYTEEELNEVKLSLEKKYKYKKPINGVSYHYDTPEAVVRVLEIARNEGTRIRVDYGYTDENSFENEAGQSWGEENDIEGVLGRSTGDIKTPLLIPRSDSLGGGGILDDCIVCIRTSTGELLYRHENYKPVMDWANATIEIGEVEGSRFEIKGYNNKEETEMVWARFGSRPEAERYLNKKRKFEIPTVSNAVEQQVTKGKTTTIKPK